MRFTETLKPSDRVDQKPPVGRNVPVRYELTAEIPPECREPAMRAIAARAHNAADARLLMEACGLIEPANGGWKRAGEESTS